MKNKQVLKNGHRSEEIEETGLLNVMQYLGWDPGTGRRYPWENW